MSMYTAIKETAKQFAFEPKIGHEEHFHHASKYVLAGMGGSHLAAGLLKMVKPELNMVIHRGYGLPTLADLSERLVILSSYSGNTEEVVDAYKKAGEHHLKRAVISIGGELLDLAQKDAVPHIRMPDLNMQPRSALPLNLLSLLKLMREETLLTDVAELQHTFHPESFEKEGKALAERLRGHIPVIYASEKNQALAYNWKIKFNETGKIPAFYNVVPELNHNEMTGFDPVEAVTAVSKRPASEGVSIFEERKKLNEPFHFIFLHDPEDHPKIQKRMGITVQLYRDRKLPTHSLTLSGNGIFHTIFNSLVLADFAAYNTALAYGLESEQVPMVEEFKKLVNE